VTQEKGTEPPFKNAYRDNKKNGIYVDIASGKPFYVSPKTWEITYEESEFS